MTQSGLLTISKHQSVNTEGWPIWSIILQLHRSTHIPSPTTLQLHLLDCNSFQIKFNLSQSYWPLLQMRPNRAWMALSTFPTSSNNTMHSWLRSWRHLLGSWVFAWMPRRFPYWFDKKKNIYFRLFYQGQKHYFLTVLGTLGFLSTTTEPPPHNFKSYKVVNQFLRIMQKATCSSPSYTIRHKEWEWFLLV